MTDQHPYPINPMADFFPRSRSARYKALVARISRYGARPAITVFGREVIFGAEGLRRVDPTYQFLDDDTEYKHQIPRRCLIHLGFHLLLR